MLTSASTLSPRARLTPSSVARRAPALFSLIQRHRNQQQARAFGFGWWTGRFDREQQREFRRRYQQAVHRRALLDQQARSDAPSCGFRRGGGRTDSLEKRSFAFGRDWRDWRDSVIGSAPSRDKRTNFVEDMHCGDWKGLAFRQSSPFYEMRGFIARRQGEILKERQKASSQSQQAESDYVIDPITNRKVSKAASRSKPDDSVDVPNSAFQSKSRPSSFSGETLDADLPPTAAELRAYRKLLVDDKLEPNLSSISNSGDANYMSWKYTSVFNRVSGGGASKKYNDLDKYKPVRDTAATTTPKSSEEEAPYCDLAKYKPVRYNEPDGKPPGYVAEETYSDLGEYKPVKHNEPDGKPHGLEASESTYNPEELSKYKEPIRHNEPDGKPQGFSEAVNSYSESELSKYTPFKWNEPDGQAPAAAPKPKKYTAGDEVMRNRVAKESNPVQPPLRGAMSKPEDYGYDRAEVDKYQGVYWNEPDGQPTTPPVELGHRGYNQEEVQQYQAVQWNEPDGQPTEPPVELGHKGYDQAEVEKYQAYRWNEPDGKPADGPVELGHTGYDQSEVQQYKPFRWNEPDGQPTSPVELGHLGYDQAEVKKYKAFRYNEPDGKTAAIKESASEASLLKQQERVKLESAMERMNAEADVIDKIASLSVKSAKKLASQGPPKHLTLGQRQQAEIDPYSTMPQGLETSYQEELGMASQPLVVKNYRSKATAESEPTSEATTAPSGTRAMYITLAWDPTRKTVDMSHATSMVYDSAAALTTKEALEKLAQPNKFKPHLEPLQAQGFEVVTATDDMLVFRQRRQNVATASTATSPVLSAPAPRFQSNINVRREEPVFSGPKTKKADGKTSDSKKVPHVAKRMIVGATWVAGVSYVLGLVGEHLK